MTVYRTSASSPDRSVRFSPPSLSVPVQSADGPLDPAAVLGAVREDIRETLRMGWVDPALEAAAISPVFFTAAWSAIRPNVGRSFLSLSRGLRTEAVETLRARLAVPDLRKDLQARLSEEEFRRAEDCARAAHLVSAKVQIVVHALYRAARREPIPGTGREEPSLRRGVPEWQRWMSFQPASEPARAALDEAAQMLQTPSPPTPLRLLARWPAALSAVWADLGPVMGTDQWKAGLTGLRRVILRGIRTLPHPVDLQWAALVARGFREDERARLSEILGAHDAAMPMQTLIAAFVWSAFGAPEIGEG